ncbi:MAG: alpha/beta fold hydrolase [Desulfobacterales bacterium]
MPRESEPIELAFQSGEYLLKGTLHLPPVVRPPIVFGSHGLMATGDSPKQIALAKRCVAEGIAYFRFDHRGCGKSGGTFKEVTSLSGRKEDLAAAVKAVRSKYELGEIGLFGSSMGGAVGIASAERLKPAAMATYAAPIRSRNINAVIETDPNAGGNMGPLYDPDGLRFDLQPFLSGLHHILVIHGNADPVVPVAHAHRIFESARDPKKIRIQTGGDHPMNNPEHQQAFLEETIEWFKMWLG